MSLLCQLRRLRLIFVIFFRSFLTSFQQASRVHTSLGQCFLFCYPPCQVPSLFYQVSSLRQLLPPRSHF
ncbi:hypothetical protein ES332_A11G111600v1 [Gossypium tomentosum]|uniref:Secreted protein n=1 Tax=Gossypium tomentosum TaxID=34277 RepID=A0A5D2N9D1_GOSTO|nr:hypothetical protein ES332_A11G111600v1 [Gossypium tomentosum]